MPDACYLDVEQSGRDVSGFLGGPLRLDLQFGARREDRTYHLEATAEIGRQKLLHQAGFACAKRAAPAGTHNHAALAFDRHVMAEEQADRHAEQFGKCSEITERRRRQATLDLADPADRTAKLQADLGERQPAPPAQGPDIAGQHAFVRSLQCSCCRRSQNAHFMKNPVKFHEK